MGKHRDRGSFSAYSDSEEEQSLTREHYALLYGGLSLGQLKMLAGIVQNEGVPTPRFTWDANQKVAVLMHGVAYAYNRRISPSVSVFEELITQIVPIPRGLDLRIAEVCMAGVVNLIDTIWAHVVSVGLATEAKLASGWDVQIACVLKEWDGTGGWMALRNHNSRLVLSHQVRSRASLKVVCPPGQQIPSFSELKKTVMSRLANGQCPLLAAAAPIVPFDGSVYQALGPVTQGARYSTTARPLTKHDQKNWRNQKKAYNHILGAIVHYYQGTRDNGQEVSEEVVELVLWMAGKSTVTASSLQQDMEFKPGEKDYVAKLLECLEQGWDLSGDVKDESASA